MKASEHTFLCSGTISVMLQKVVLTFESGNGDLKNLHLNVNC